VATDGKIFESETLLEQFYFDKCCHLWKSSGLLAISVTIFLHGVNSKTKHDELCIWLGFRYDVEGRSGILLRLLCCWVGKEFARLRSAINRRADQFKAQNIDRIDCLPSARQTVDFIFPQCMILLILCWMDSDTIDCIDSFSNSRTSHQEDSGTSSFKTLDTSNQERITVSEDHSYSTDSNQSHLYAFAQLILEFANGCLVSGITHVLYPRLLQAQL
jgi:hypothetical protein